MKQTYLAEILPKQEKGMKTDTESAVTCKDPNEAKEHFRRVRERLHTINQWHHYAGKGTAAFQLYDAQGNPVHRPVRKGDYFQIDIPGPGSKSGEGKDWVEVQQMGDRDSEDEELSFVTVRSASHPLSLETKPAHFFASTATSSFVVYRDSLRVMAAVYGRNEQANSGANNLFDRIRNSLIAFGAFLGMSKLQWKAFTEGIVKKEPKA